jgi:hypothetical protein
MPGGGLKDLGADDSGLDETDSIEAQASTSIQRQIQAAMGTAIQRNGKGARGPAMADKPRGFQATAGDRVSRSMQSCSRMERVESLEGDCEKKLFR